MGCSGKRGKSGDGEDGSEVYGGGGRVEISWSLVCRWLGFVWRILGRTEDDGGTFCYGG